MKKLIDRCITLVLSPTARSTYTLFTGNTLDAFFAFLFTVLSFRLLTTGEFGIFSAINNFVVLAFSILDVGVGSGLINFVSYYYHKGEEKKAREYFKAGLLLRATLAATVSTLLISFSWIIAPRLFVTQEYPAVMLAGFAILGLSLLDVITFSLQAYQKFFFSALSSTSFSFTRVALILSVFLFHRPYSVTTAMLFTALAPAIGVLAGLKFLKFSFKESRPSKETYKSLLSFSGWIGVNKIASSIAGKIDVQLLLLLSGPLSTGIYSVASRVASFYAVIVTSLSAVMAPKLASGKSISELKQYLLKAALAIAVLIGGMVGITIFAKPFILLLFGQKAINSVAPFQGLTLANIPFVASSLAISIIIYNLKKPKIIGLIAIFQAIIVTSSNLVLIPKYNYFGAIIATAVAQVSILIVTTIVVISHWRRSESK